MTPIVAAERGTARGGAERLTPAATRGQVVAVFSPKGGVGRTTIAVNLAVAAVDRARQEGRRSSTARSSSATSASC